MLIRPSFAAIPSVVGDHNQDICPGEGVFAGELGEDVFVADECPGHEGVAAARGERQQRGSSAGDAIARDRDDLAQRKEVGEGHVLAEGDEMTLGVDRFLDAFGGDHRDRVAVAGAAAIQGSDHERRLGGFRQAGEAGDVGVALQR